MKIQIFFYILVSLEDHSDNDCLVIIVMTHGNENGKILAADREYDVQDLWTNFVGNKCESLIGKPKLFFIQVNKIYYII